MARMRIYPAIDIKDGKCVRLRRGEASDKTVYFENPMDAARAFADAGADRIHVVDLDGAFAGNLANMNAVSGIASLGIFVELGGGMRSADAVRRAFDAGVSRAIVGTRACTNPEFAGELVGLFGERIAVGIDAKDGMVAIKGWVEVSERKASDFAVQMAEMGVKYFVYTDISTDGMLTGPNLAAQAAMRDILSPFGASLIASGGVSCREDIEALNALGGLEGAIVGKAIYEKRVDLRELLSIVRG